MLASLNFINHFISLPKKTSEICINGNIFKKELYEVEQISSILTQQGFEVDAVRHFGAEFKSVVVGQIKRVEKHPDASRLNICFVDAKEENLRQIVCGANNVCEGMYVAVALPGTQLPSDHTMRPGQPKEVTFEIKSSTIRNVESHGMLCARSELGLTVSDVDGDGIWDLSNDAQGGSKKEHLEKNIGCPVFIALGLEDTLLELSVTPNRPDVLCQQGVARELAAGFAYRQIPFDVKSFDISYYYHKDKKPDEHDHPHISASQIISDVNSNSTAECGQITFEALNCLQANAFFVVLELTEKQTHTPAWIRNLLEPLEQNSINLLVDISNFILVAYGQPNHAFDLDSIDKDNPQFKKLILRHAHPNEEFTGLDGKTRLLHQSDCVVSDSSIPQALLGVVGGQFSKIKDTTTKIVLEFANPNQTAVRHSARRHSKQTVASFMFEKGIDVAARFQAASDFIEILSHTMNHRIKYRSSIHSKNSELTPIVQTEFTTTLLPYHMCDQKQILGAELIPFSEQIKILASLGFKINSSEMRQGASGQSPESVMVCVPTWRSADVLGTADLVEECIRIVGIDKVPAIPMNIIATVDHDDPHLPKLEQISSILCALGYHETIGLNFMREDDWQKLNFASHSALGTPVKILNPVIGDEPIMQTTLVPDLLRKVARNMSYGIRSGMLFTSSRTFFQPQGSEHLPIEVNKIAGIGFGEKTPKTWQNSSSKKRSLHDLMSHFNAIGQCLGINLKFEKLENNPFMLSLHPKKAIQCAVEMDDKSTQVFGWLGELHPIVKRNYECDGVDIFLFEIDMDKLIRLQSLMHCVVRSKISLPRFPLISRDFSFILDESITSAQIEECVRSALTPIFETELIATLRNIQVFDIYRGQGVPENKKSVTFKIVVEPLEKTFTEQEISIFSTSVIKSIANSFSAEQRV